MEAYGSESADERPGRSNRQNREIFLLADAARLGQPCAWPSTEAGRGPANEGPLERGSFPNRLLGLGFFTCRREDPARREGVLFDVCPTHLRNPLLEEILHGRFSPLTQGIVLYGGADAFGQAAKQEEAKDGLRALQQWALVGVQPLSELRSGGVPLSPFLQRISLASTLQQGVDHLFTSLSESLERLGYDALLVPLDSAIIVDFFYNLFGRFPFGIALSEKKDIEGTQLTALEREICSLRVSEEILKWFAEKGGDRAVYLYCQSRRHVQALFSICREIKTMGLAVDVNFRI